MSEAKLTPEQVMENLTYNPETGELFWRKTGKGRPPLGTPAGVINALGYRTIGLAGKRHYAHRIAWLIHYGWWPSNQIDHINGDRADNRITNLRECSHAENQLNRHAPRPNKHGFKGVDVCPKSGRFRARVVVRKKKHNLGYFDTAEEAHQAFLKARRALNPFASD